MEMNSYTNFVLRIMSILMGIVSLALVFAGTFHQEWWGGFGIVLLMTSLVTWVGLFGAAEEGEKRLP